MTTTTTMTATITRPYAGTPVTLLGHGADPCEMHATPGPEFMRSGITAPATDVRITVTAFDRDRATGFAVKQGRPPRELLC